MKPRRVSLSSLASLCALALSPGAAAAAPRYSAAITRTAYGIPHIVAPDYAGLGYGYGYAFAQDDLCTLADDIVTVNGERSRYFGPNGLTRHAGDDALTVNNLASDVFYQSIKDRHIGERLAREPAPNGIHRDQLAVLEGFAAGYDRYLRQTGRDDLSDPACRGERWVRLITVLDLELRLYKLSLTASSGQLIDELFAAQPPQPVTAASASATRQPLAATPRLGSALPSSGHTIGSNALALGGNDTRNGRGVLLGNPHFT